MRRRHSTWIAALALFLPEALARAQTTAPPPLTQAPPVLSTVAEPPAGATSEPGQMSGVPLQVGDLPPGIVVVRVIRSSFQDNVTGQAVTLRVGAGARVLTAVTGADGRAQFDGLSVGERVQVRSTVGAERLESQLFDLPKEGGVRLVLVAGVGAPTALGDEWPAASVGGAEHAGELAALPLDRPPAAAPSSSLATNAWLAGLIGAMALTLGMMVRGRRKFVVPSAARSPATNPIPVAPPPLVVPAAVAAEASRAVLFERLVSLEKDHQAGKTNESEYPTVRSALIEQLARLDVNG